MWLLRTSRHPQTLRHDSAGVVRVTTHGPDWVRGLWASGQGDLELQDRQDRDRSGWRG